VVTYGTGFEGKCRRQPHLGTSNEWPRQGRLLAAAEEELETLEKKHAWEIVSREDWMKVLSST